MQAEMTAIQEEPDSVSLDMFAFKKAHYEERIRDLEQEVADLKEVVVSRDAEIVHLKTDNPQLMCQSIKQQYFTFSGHFILPMSFLL